MKTSNIQVYGNSAVFIYITYLAVCLKIDYILRCLVQYLQHQDTTDSHCIQAS